MLVLTRIPGQTIKCVVPGVGVIEFCVSNIQGRRVKVAIEAPAEVVILRGEHNAAEAVARRGEAVVS